MISKFDACLGALAFVGLVASVSAAPGCTITTTDRDDHDHNDPTGSTQSGGGEDGEGGEGGAGGDGGTGGNGAGVGGGGGEGGEGGAGGAGAECVIDETSGKDVTSCDHMNITPDTVPGGSASPTCGPNEDQNPPGYGVCLRAFEIYLPGSAEHLQTCLSEIGVEPANACNPDLVTKCVQNMYDASTSTCSVYFEEAREKCQANADWYAQNAGDTSCQEEQAMNACIFLSVPLNETARNDLNSCIDELGETDPKPTCKQAFATCEAKLHETASSTFSLRPKVRSLQP